MRDAVRKFCARIGSDPLLVQGAGGNVSWKEGNTLWVKASGTWLADAERNDIFVPVDLRKPDGVLDDAGAGREGEGGDGPAPRPSIEAGLHAIVPRTVVAHLHAVEALAVLVRIGAQDELAAKLDDRISWELVEYHQPGAKLAAAVRRALRRRPSADVIFLRNHGLVVAGHSVDAVETTLAAVVSALKHDVACGKARCERAAPGGPPPGRLPASEETSLPGYAEIEDGEIQNIVHDPDLYRRLSDAWALYPDHVVFLGAEAHVFDSRDHAAGFSRTRRPPLIFIRSDGVFAARGFDAAKLAQLRCYYDVLVRQRPEDVQVELAEREVDALVNWGAEHYRRTRARRPPAPPAGGLQGDVAASAGGVRWR